MIETHFTPLPVNIVVAHSLEAKALVPMLQLKREASPAKNVQYSNSNGLSLIVSGIGKQAVEAAVASLAEQQANEEGQIRAWLNIGIAGHRDAPLGSAWLGNKITDLASGASAYPPQLISGIKAGSVITVDEPENNYPSNAAYEMEASAFYAEAAKYSTAELVQVFKIVSDNLQNPISEMDLQGIPNLIARQAATLDKLLSRLGALVEQHNVHNSLPSYYHDMRSRLRLTANQKLQFKRLCQRYKALGLEGKLGTIGDAKVSDAKQLIRLLSQHIEQVMDVPASEQ
jgi:nucleoside phosphorylase